LVLLGVVLGVLAIVAGTAPSRADAEGFWTRVSPGDFHAYQWVEDGVKSDRFLSEKAFNRMAERASYGVQSLGTGVGSGYASQASEGASIATKLKTIGTTAGTLATVRSLKGDTLGLMSRLKSYGLLKSLGTIALAATSFEVGWKIGTAISGLFGFGKSEEKIEGSYIRNASTEKAYAAGETLPVFGGTDFKVPAPRDGFVVQFSCSPSCGSELPAVQPHASADSEGHCKDRQINFVPGTATFIQTGTIDEYCSGKTYALVQGVYFDPLAVECLPGEEGCAGEAPKTIETAKQTPEKASSGTTIVENCLVAAACGRFAGWWWNHDPEAQEDTERSVGAGVDLEPSDPLQVRVPSFGAHETYVEYDEKLEALELVPEDLVLPEAWVNPSYGPLEVTQVNPKPTTQLQPETVVKVRYNPETAAESSPGTESGTPSGGWSPPGIPPIDLEPLTETGLGCSTFPFGVFCWFGEAVEAFAVSPVCPLEVSVPIEAFGSSDDFEINGCSVGETVMAPLRLVILACATIGLVILFAKQAMGTGGEDA
jgi:hypothetical protein